MKLIAMYLPQFHEILENNDAWGKGFWKLLQSFGKGSIGKSDRYGKKGEYLWILLLSLMVSWQDGFAEDRSNAS